MAKIESPAAYLRSLLPEGKKRIDDDVCFIPPNDKRLDAYDMESVTAIRTKDLTKLRSLLSSGKSFEGCNRAGESLLHLACRRADSQTVSFLIEEAFVETNVRDELGRTILHDACWRPSPDFQIMDALIHNASPNLLLAEDVRGHTCFDYVRKSDWSAWMQYLERRREVILQRVSLFESIKDSSLQILG